MATAHKLTNKAFSQWQVDQSLAFAKESIDSRFCPGYAMKNPTLVGILMKMQMDLEDKLDAQDFENKVEKKVTEPVTETDITKVEFTYKILSESFKVNQIFTAKEAYNAIRPYRFSNEFKSEESYRGTILAELQVLRDDKRLRFYAGGKSGTYCLLR
jgi:hypothetical protein